MALPPKGDPRRPLHLAIRSTRVLAIILILFGSCSFVPMLMRGANVGRNIFRSISVLILYMGPGAAYLVFSIYLKQRQFWAVIGALVLASLQLLFTLLGTAVFTIDIFNMPVQSQSGFMTIPIGIAVLVILALAQLIYHLTKSFEAIKYVPLEEQHGFEPIMIQPIDPPIAPEDSAR